MKKLILLLLSVLMVLSLTACQFLPFNISRPNEETASKEQSVDEGEGVIVWNDGQYIYGDSWSGIIGGNVNPDGSVTITIPGTGDVGDTVPSDPDQPTQNTPDYEAPDQNENHTHRWTEATCQNPKTCKVCGATSGSKTGHKGGEATCFSKAHCDYCGQQYGSYASHNYAPATCQEPKTCYNCGATSGSPKSHSYVNATCDSAKYCSVCNERFGDALGHSYSNGSCIRCGQSDPSVQKVKIIGTLPSISGFGKITSARGYVSGGTVWLELKGTRNGGASSGTVHWYLFGNGYKDAGDGSVSISGISTGGSFTKTVSLGSASSSYSSYSITLTAY